MTDHDEDPLDHLGPVTEDPWQDPEQADWPDGLVDLDLPVNTEGVPD